MSRARSLSFGTRELYSELTPSALERGVLSKVLVSLIPEVFAVTPRCRTEELAKAQGIKDAGYEGKYIYGTSGYARRRAAKYTFPQREEKRKKKGEEKYRSADARAARRIIQRDTNFALRSRFQRAEEIFRDAGRISQ